MDDAAGIILVGGASKRYGKPKALEIINGKTFLERVFKELSQLTNSVFVSYSEKTPEEALDLAVQLGGKPVKDKDLPCNGPPRGLSSITTDIVHKYRYFWIVAVDYPYIKADTLGKIAEMAEETSVEALSPLLQEGYPAVTLGYVRNSVLQTLKESCILRKHLTRTTDMYRGAKNTIYPDWSHFSSTYIEFLNMNTTDSNQTRISTPSRTKIILSKGDLFLESLTQIRNKNYYQASILYLMESEQYESLELFLLSIHARKDAQRVIEIRNREFYRYL
ncbi:MAG: NTP transferase domain-containing protein [Desulfurococcales archaeon]|nr:NTP transferase domain-containing protein [Desulfurococcales archaeon]